MRLRYFLAINIPLGRAGAEKRPFYLSAYNEIFMDTKKERAFDRNRLYGGLGYRLNPKIRFEFGYMNQFLSASDPARTCPCLRSADTPRATGQSDSVAFDL